MRKKVAIILLIAIGVLLIYSIADIRLTDSLNWDK